MRKHGGMEGVGGRDADSAWRRPFPGLLRMRLFELAGVVLVVAAVAGVIVGFAAAARYGAVAAVAAALAGLILVPFVTRRIRSWGYSERDDDLLVRHGLLVARLSVVPYGR